MTVDFRRETLADLVAQVRSRSVSARDLAQAALARIEAVNPAVNAFVAVDGDRALADAAALDERIAAGEDVGALAGIPVGIKDTEDVRGYRTTYGSRAYADDPVAERDSILVERLREAGCVVVGKTNTPELASKGNTTNDLFGVTHNPIKLGHSAGGSSGGAAAAVQAGMVPLATGSDGGGSIRIPSSACGLTGHKPSLGRVPDGGPAPVDWMNLTTRGVIARSAADIALALDCVVGPDPTDLRSLPMPDRPWVEAVAEPALPLRVAWSPTLGYADPDPEVLERCEAAISLIADSGCEVEQVDPVFDADPIFFWITLVGWYNVRTREQREGPWETSISALSDMIAQTGPLDLVKAEDECHRMNLRLVDIFRRSRLLLTPTTALAPPPVEQADNNWFFYTYPFNMTRSPAGTVCAGFTSDGLPVGLQVVGPQHGDAVVLRALAALEDLVDVPRPELEIGG
jgi:aspartyl-tRNA(Asn)/glutamyl-tRNA(Gln) amidotransferase subunit A